jgi:hypothetical protein
MSEITALKDLARFVAKSPLASEDLDVRRTAVNALVQSIAPRPERKRVSDLLSTVVALSARTRRLVQPRVEVDVDVFTPDNARAVRIFRGED